MTISQIVKLLHFGNVCVGDRFNTPDGLIVEVIETNCIRVSQNGESHIWEAPRDLVFTNPTKTLQ